MPTLALGSKTFEHDFNTSAKVFGVPGVPYLVMTEQALVTMNESQIHQRVDGIIDKLSEKFH